MSAPADEPNCHDCDRRFEDEFAAWVGGLAGERLYWLAERDGASIGMLSLLVYRRMPRPGRRDSCWGYVGNVYVRPQERDRGVGRALLDATVDHATGQGFVRLVLSPSARSVPFYRRAGFVPATRLHVLELARDQSARDAVPEE